MVLCTRGNHEDMFIGRFLRKNADDYSNHRRNGGRRADAIDNTPEVDVALELILGCPISMTIECKEGRVGVVHASVIENDWNEQERQSWPEASCMWSAENYFDEVPQKIAGIDLVVSGHVSCRKVTWAANQVFIDTILRAEKFTVMSTEELLRAMVRRQSELGPAVC